MSSNKFIIPRENDLLDADIKSRKPQYVNHVFNVISHSVETSNPLPEKISIFQFKDTQLEVIVKQPSYIANLENLLDYYIELEEYEKCNSIKKLIKKIEDIETDTNQDNQD